MTSWRASGIKRRTRREAEEVVEVQCDVGESQVVKEGAGPSW